MRKSLSDEFGVFFRLILVCVCVLFLFSHVTEMLSHLSIVLLHVTHIELLCFRCLVLPSVFVCAFFFHPKVFRHIVLHVPTHCTSTANRSAQRFVRFYVPCECVPTFIIIVMIFFSSSCLLCAAYH